MMPLLDRRPIVVAIAGPNGAGKTTFYHSHLRQSGLRFVNADVIAEELNIGAYEAAKAADVARRELIATGQSFAFETVFSDPVGDKLAFLLEAEAAGYAVVLFFIGVSGPDVSSERVGMRVLQGGHSVPLEKLASRYPRTLANLRDAIRRLPCVIVYDNDDLSEPYRQVAVFERGKVTYRTKEWPKWLKSLDR